MRRKAISVAALAREANVDADEVLVTLWDLGATDLLEPRDTVPSRYVERARECMGIATRRQLNSVRYWTDLLGVTRTELRELLLPLGIELKDNRTRVPRGAPKRLKAHARKKGIDPSTGVIRSPSREESRRVSKPPPAPPAPSFAELGRLCDMRLLRADDVRAIHDVLVRDFAKSGDPIDPPGIRDVNLLESAVFRPHTSLGDTRKYPTVETSAAALLCALIHDHPFHNGNKRTALVATLVFLDNNGSVLTCQEDDLFRFVLMTAQHRMGRRHHGRHVPDLEMYAVAEQLCQWSRSVIKDEYPMTFRKLRPILAGYGCETSVVSGRAKIVREMSAPKKGYRRYFGQRVLRTQVFYADEGRDVPADTVKKIRRDLHLDDEHGIDSHDFYSKKAHQVDDFIAKYRKTLVRLAKL